MKDLPSGLRIESIQRHHNLKGFDCGEPSLNQYLRHYALKNDTNSIARSSVLIDEANNVLGYYAICAANIEFAELPEPLAKRVPKYPIPAARLARLAVSNPVQGCGVGGWLLIDALQKIHNTSLAIGLKVVVVDALNGEAKSFYEHYGFINLSGQVLKLFLPIETVASLFA